MDVGIKRKRDNEPVCVVCMDRPSGARLALDRLVPLFARLADR